jgi:DNA replication protein DnaC
MNNITAELTERGMKSVRHQMAMAKFPVHRDLAEFDFNSSSIDQVLVKQLATLTFTDSAQNAVFIGGKGTGKTHIAITIAVSGITTKGNMLVFIRLWTLSIYLKRKNGMARRDVLRCR